MNLSPEVFAGKIFYYKNVIKSPKDLVSLIDQTDEQLKNDNDAILKWKKWTASDDESYVFGYQKQTDPSKLKTSSDAIKQVYTTLTEALEVAGKNYCLATNLEYFPPSPLSISKYIAGASMGPHVDTYPGDGKSPVMSGVLYLNDDYTGGELDFPLQGVRIKPEAGSIIIFPSVEPFFHQSLEVVAGEKYMSPVFWIGNL